MNDLSGKYNIIGEADEETMKAIRFKWTKREVERRCRKRDETLRPTPHNRPPYIRISP